QARNAFAPVIDGDPDKKPPFTRVQYGATLGGPIYKDRSFFFASFEQRRRQESGFFTGDILAGDSSGRMTSSISLLGQTYTGLTPTQVQYIQSILPINANVAVAYAEFASAGSQTALNGASTLVNLLPTPIGVGNVIGSRFLLSGAPIPLTR